MFVPESTREGARRLAHRRDFATHIGKIDMTTTLTETLCEAINRSISHTQIVAVEVEADDISQAVASIGGEWDIDYARENDGSYDVWGCVADDTEPSSEDMAWRLNVTINQQS